MCTVPKCSRKARPGPPSPPRRTLCSAGPPARPGPPVVGVDSEGRGPGPRPGLAGTLGGPLLPVVLPAGSRRRAGARGLSAVVPGAGAGRGPDRYSDAPADATECQWAGRLAPRLVTRWAACGGRRRPTAATRLSQPRENRD